MLIILVNERTVPTTKGVGNFIVPRTGEGMTPKARMPGHPRMMLYFDYTHTTKKVNSTVRAFGPSLIVNRRQVFPRALTISLENPTMLHEFSTMPFLAFLFNLLK